MAGPTLPWDGGSLPFNVSHSHSTEKSHGGWSLLSEYHSWEVCLDSQLCNDHQYSMPDARRLGIRRTSAGGSVVTMMDDLLKIMLWGNAMQWWHIGFDLEPLSWRYNHCVIITMKGALSTWAWRWSIPPMSALLPPCGFSPTSPLLWLLTRKIFLLY